MIPESDGSYYRTLTGNMILIMLSVSITPIILMSGMLLYYFDVTSHEKVTQNLKILASKHKDLIDFFLRERLTDIRFLVRIRGLAELRDQRVLEKCLLDLKEGFDKSIVDLGVVDENGIQVAYAGEFKLLGADYSKAVWFEKAGRSEFFISDVFSGLRGSPHFIVGTRITGEDRSWILRATVNFDSFNALVEKIHPGSSGFAFIINKQGEFQTRERPEVKIRELLPMISRNRDGSQDGISVFEMNDSSGATFTYAVAPLLNVEWLLGLQQSSSEAYSILYYVRRLALVIFVVGVIGTVAASAILAHRMVRHIAKGDREKEILNKQVIEAGKLASLGELAAGIAHEVNNPTAIMIEEAGWLKDVVTEENWPKNVEKSELLTSIDQIRTQGSRCKEITYKLLSFARRTDPTIKSIRLNNLVAEVVDLSRRRAKYSNVEIITNLAPEIPELNVPPSEMQQVILNLINNAIDALEPKGGTISVSTIMSYTGVLIKVSDNGPGISATNLPRIFDPFFTTKPVGKGTGLGLSICYGIIKKMGGEIRVDSVEGKGTTFLVGIGLPLSRADESSDTAQTPKSSSET